MGYRIVQNRIFKIRTLQSAANPLIGWQSKSKSIILVEFCGQEFGFKKRRSRRSARITFVSEAAHKALSAGELAPQQRCPQKFLRISRYILPGFQKTERAICSQHKSCIGFHETGYWIERFSPRCSQSSLNQSDSSTGYHLRALSVRKLGVLPRREHGWGSQGAAE
jgi:hypothetical protein